MAELTPIPFPDLVRRMRREVEASDSIFDLPIRKWFVPPEELDFSALHFGRRAATPVGPAAGPHTQLAQNIVLSWLAGARIMELKTVQINDRLTIPRPCIHVPNVGYNVEWSQELLVEESLLEYAKAVYLIEILKATRVFGRMDVPGFERSTDTVYDISVGYDLAGIRSEKVTGFLRAMTDSGAVFDRLRRQMAGDLSIFAGIELPEAISDCVTLSTFHGCPAHEIESIARYLLEDLGLHTIIKLNPTLLGFDSVREILINRLGYDSLRLKREAFDSDLQYEDGLDIVRRLRRVAEARGSTIGAKFTNTLVVENDPGIFPTQPDPYMYVSGPPLHVISMTLMQRFREDLGFEIPISFSAGIDKVNFPAAVACGMVPVTTCTDLLKQGGYGRLPRYLLALAKEMRKMGVTGREAYVLSRYGHGHQAAVEAFRQIDVGKSESLGKSIDGAHPDDVPRVLRQAAVEAGLDPEEVVLRATRIAGRLNGVQIVGALVDDPRYSARLNEKPPRQIESVLERYDCINCDLCIWACPNDAIFAYDVEPVEVNTRHLVLQEDGILREQGSGFSVREYHQLAVLEAGCNECSNCEVYCPEEGAPFKVKERVFLTGAEFEREVSLDGFCVQDGVMRARVDGIEYALEPDPSQNKVSLTGPGFTLEADWDTLTVVAVDVEANDSLFFDTALLWRMKTVWDAIFHALRPNPVHREAH